MHTNVSPPAIVHIVYEPENRLMPFERSSMIDKTILRVGMYTKEFFTFLIDGWAVEIMLVI